MTLIFFDVNIEGTRVVINSRMVRGRETFVTISLYSAHSGHFPLHGQSLAVNAEFVCDFPASISTPSPKQRRPGRVENPPGEWQGGSHFVAFVKGLPALPFLWCRRDL